MLEFGAIYLVLGAAVSVAVLLEPRGATRAARLFRVATALLFWPLYVPLLLAARGRGGRGDDSRRTDVPADGMARAIGQVERELASALAGLDGWAEDVLARERGRLGELQRAWRAQADRIREIDRLLGNGENGNEACDVFVAGGDEGDAGGAERLRRYEEARRENIARLHAIRRQAYADLMGTLAWVRELASMIHLARFTGAPAARAEELVAQIAAAVEGLSEVNEWEYRPKAGQV